MKVIFDLLFVKEQFTLFIISSIIIVLMIAIIFYLGIKEIKKNVK